MSEDEPNSAATSSRPMLLASDLVEARRQATDIVRRLGFGANTNFDVEDTREAASLILESSFRPDESDDPSKLSFSVGFTDPIMRRIYCLMAVHLFNGQSKNAVAKAWRVRHAELVGIIEVPSKWRFGLLETRDSRKVLDAELDTLEHMERIALKRLLARVVAPPHWSARDDASEAALEESVVNRQIDELTKVTAELLAVVAAQQQEIEELRRRLDAATLARVQTEITKLAQDHHHALFAQARETIGSLGLASGEVSVGEIEHKGSLVVRLMRTGEDTRARSGADRGTDTQKVDVGAEVRGLAARIANVGVDVGAQTSKVRERTEAAEQSRLDAESQQYEGTFETRQKGSTIRWSR